MGGFAYELGRPFLDFLCYEPERFDDAFAHYADIFNNEQAHASAMHPDFIAEIKSAVVEFQTKEVYVFLYYQLFMDFIYKFIESPYDAVKMLESIIPGTEEKLEWAMDFRWPEMPLGKIYFDKQKRLHRAALDAVSIMSEHLRMGQRAMTAEVNALLMLKEKVAPQTDSPLEYLYLLEMYRQAHGGDGFVYLEDPFRTFYGIVKEPEIAQLYSIINIADLCRFEFIKMIEHNIFIKKCANCSHFFIPRGRADTEYCARINEETGRRCNEIGAMKRYEKKVAENPILDAHKRAYRRLNSRVRNKKMTQAEFLKWTDEAAKKRDMCLTGELPFEELVAWLEQGRIRKPRGSGGKFSN